MGFFQDLKQDLSQAVNELLEEDKSKEAVKATEIEKEVTVSEDYNSSAEAIETPNPEKEAGAKGLDGDLNAMLEQLTTNESLKGADITFEDSLFDDAPKETGKAYGKENELAKGEFKDSQGFTEDKLPDSIEVTGDEVTGSQGYAEGDLSDSAEMPEDKAADSLEFAEDKAEDSTDFTVDDILNSVEVTEEASDDIAFTEVAVDKITEDSDNAGEAILPFKEIGNEADDLQATLATLLNDITEDEEPEKQDELMPSEDYFMENLKKELEIVKQTKVENEVGKMSEKMMNVTKEVLDETAVITKGMTIKGDVISEGSIDLIGCVEGNIEILGKLNVTGCILGNTTAAEVYADSAKVTGEINSEGTVKIGPSSVIIGGITATTAVIAGAVKGDIDVHGPVVLDTSAIVMGNIKSKSVQINNGAVIEGLCSQCYADVNPISFFDDFK